MKSESIFGPVIFLNLRYIKGGVLGYNNIGIKKCTKRADVRGGECCSGVCGVVVDSEVREVKKCKGPKMDYTSWRVAPI